ncbi:PH domain-containing protein [Frankia gtarii]|uniref:PH domain-containing protein n=1 Tax=Frankia gtarii TaxID=2950102 RepID=UPI0034D58B21
MVRAQRARLVVRNLLLSHRLRWDEVRGLRVDDCRIAELARGPELTLLDGAVGEHRPEAGPA